MLRRLVLYVTICCASTPAALAQADANYDPAMVQAAQSVNTPEKITNMLRDKFHVVVSTSWPTNFPVPVYTSNVVQTSFSHSTQGQPTAAASLITKDPSKQVFDFYQSACTRANWTVSVPSAKALAELRQNGSKIDDVYFLTAEQGKQSLFLTCTRNSKTNTTLVSISWRKKP